jgi:hypothetical protein
MYCKQKDIVYQYSSEPKSCIGFVLHVLNGCETRSLTLRKERRLRVFGNRVLKRIFVTERDDVTGE